MILLDKFGVIYLRFILCARPARILPAKFPLWTLMKVGKKSTPPFEKKPEKHIIPEWLLTSFLSICTANAAGEDLLPYFNDVMDHLKIYLISNSDTTPDFIKVWPIWLYQGLTHLICMSFFGPGIPKSFCLWAVFSSYIQFSNVWISFVGCETRLFLPSIVNL